MLFRELRLLAGSACHDTAIITEDLQILSYEELSKILSVLTAELFSWGVHGHMRVATIAENGTANSLLMLAVMESGVCCPLSSSFTHHELSQQLLALEAEVVICSESIHKELRDVCDRLGIPLVSFRYDSTKCGLTLQPAQGDGGARSNQHAYDLTPKQSSDYSLILLTSGSTGKPKRVGLSIHNLMHSAREVAASLQLGPTDVCLSMWEQYHIGGVVDLLLAPLIAGSSIEMTSGFSAQNFRQAMKRGQLTWTQCVPTTLREMLHAVKADHLDIPDSLRLVRSVASNLSPDLQQDAESIFGVPVLQTYGMTEASPLITSNQLPAELRKPGTVGKPLSTQIKIIRKGVSVDTAGDIGEILVRGKNVILSYDDPSGETASCFSDGWFRTGDLGYFDDDGFLCLSGREKQQINRGGEKISPKEVEDCCIGYMAIEDAIAFSLPHPTLGSVPGLIVASQQPATETMQASLRGHLKQRLSAYKQPSRIWWVDRLPKTVTGKILHSELEILLEELQAQSKTEATDTSVASEGPQASYIERALQGIWSEELARSSVGLHDDFVSLGGDSLSSVRVLMAAERRFGIHYPSERWQEMTTVQAMARCTEELLRQTLARHNRSLGDQEQPSTAIMNGIDGKSELEFTISTGISGDIRIDEFTDEELAFYLINQTSVIQAKAAIERRRNLWTPKELLTFIGLYEALSPSHATSGSGAQQQVLLYLHGIRNSLPADTATMWQATPICAGARLYQALHTKPTGNSKTTESKGKTLIVGFGGYFNRMMMAMDTWLSQLDSHQYDFLFIWDESRRFYNCGVDGLGQNADAMSEGLRQIIQSLGYNRVIGLGVSMGAYPCAAISRHLKWKGGVVVCPDLGKNHPPYQQMLKGSGQSSPLLVYCGAENEADIIASKQLAAEPFTQLQMVRGCSGHNLLWFLYQRQAMATFLKRSVDALNTAGTGQGKRVR